VRIAVTGSAGLLGRAVVDLARSQGHEVVGIDRAEGVDVTDFGALSFRVRGCDALVHLAAHIRPGDLPDHVVHNENVVGSYNALAAAVDAGITRVCLASSVNAIGGAYSRRPRYDYFPVDERHPSYAEDPYSLSKWIAEQQADAVARRHEGMTVASLRIHGIRTTRPRRTASPGGAFDVQARHLWGYSLLSSTAAACLLSLGASYTGHEVFYIVAPSTAFDTPSGVLAATFYPDVPVREGLVGTAGFFDCGKAHRLLGWTH
jgi:nucleoside-diphosphate-sugar epimerase